MNNASIVTDQTTHQIWPSEILQGTSYCVLTLPDAPPMFFFSWGWVEVLDTRLPQCKKKSLPLFFCAGIQQPENEANKKTFPLIDFICLHSLCILNGYRRQAELWDSAGGHWSDEGGRWRNHRRCCMRR